MVECEICEAVQNNQTIREKTFGEDNIICLRENCPYDNCFVVHYDDYEIPICKSHGVKQSDLIRLTEVA